MQYQILTNARIIAPDCNFIGSVVIEGALITELIPNKYYREGKDLHGMWLAPGCIDIHSDYLEREIHPRPGANFSLPLAFHFTDQRAAACGITTLYNAISFSENEYATRSFENALERAEVLDQLRNGALVRHFLHARLDTNTSVVLQFFDRMLGIGSLNLMVYNENIPGQRQYKLEDIIDKWAKMKGITLDESKALITEKIERLSKINHRPEIFKALGQNMKIGSHDDTSIAHVEEAHLYGATLAEMPTTIEAARKAKEMGMWVCMGAPNYVRGGSHCGNLSCIDAMQEGLVDILCSDYHFPTMLSSVIKMMQAGISPSDAMYYVSLGPAKFLEIDQQLGSIAIGKKADMVCFKLHDEFAEVRHLWVDGFEKYTANPFHATPQYIKQSQTL